MWKHKVSQLLSQLGWGSGFRIPIANNENLDLEQELEKRQRLLQQKHSELEDNTKHTEILEKGIKNVTAHVYHDKKIIHAKRAEISAEVDLFKSAEREGRKFVGEYKEIQKILKITKLQNKEIFSVLASRKENIAELAELIKYDRKELAELEKAAIDENQCLKVVEDLTDQDSETLKKYEKRYKRASEDTSSKRSELDKKVSLTRVLQSELDGLNVRFRKLHKDRGEIVELWKETLDSLSSRDDTMKEIAEKYADENSKFKKLTKKLEDGRNKLNEIMNQSSVTAMQQLTRWDRKVTDLRDIIQNFTELNQELEEDLFSFEAAIAYASNQTKELYVKAAEINSEVSSRNGRVLEILNYILELRTKIEQDSGKMLNVAERIKQLYAMIEDEENKFEKLTKQLEKEMLEKGQWNNTKAALSEKSRDLDIEIHCAQNNLSMLSSKGTELAYTFHKRQATIYRIELKKISIQLKFGPLVNPRVDDSKKYEEGEKLIVAMKSELDEILRKKNFINDQIANLVNINRRVYREWLAAEKEVSTLDTNYSTTKCYVNFIIKNLEQKMQEYQEAFVSSSLVQLRLGQMNKALKQQKSLLYDSGHQRELLEAAVKEKRSEVKMHSRLLEMKHRGLKDQMSQLKMQLVNVTTSVGRKRNRYELIMKLMGSDDDEDQVSEAGEVKSEAYYVMKMAQEREMLQMEGQKWKVRMEEAEKELEGMTNAQTVMNASNESLKNSLEPAGENSEEMSILKELAAKEQEILMRRNRAKMYRTVLRDRKHEVDEQMAVMDQDLQSTLHLNEIKEDLRMRTEIELRRQKAKISRWHTLCTKQIKATKRLIPPDRMPLLKLDLKLRFTMRKFESAIGVMEKVLAYHPNLYFFFEKLSKQDSTIDKIFSRFRESTDSGKSSSSSSATRTSTGSVSDLNNNSRLSDSESSSNPKSSVRPNKGLNVVQMSPQNRLKNQFKKQKKNADQDAKTKI